MDSASMYSSKVWPSGSYGWSERIGTVMKRGASSGLAEPSSCTVWLTSAASSVARTTICHSVLCAVASVTHAGEPLSLITSTLSALHRTSSGATPAASCFFGDMNSAWSAIAGTPAAMASRKTAESAAGSVPFKDFCW